MLDPAVLNDHAIWILTWVLRTSLSAAGVAVVILAVQLVFSRRLSAAWRYRLWAVLVIRLLLPVLPASPVSLANFRIAERASSVWARLTQPVPIKPLPVPSNPETVDVNHVPPGLTVTVVKQPLSPRPFDLMPADVPPSTPKPSFVALLLLGAWLSLAGLLFLRLVICNLALARRLRAAQRADAEAILLLQVCCAEIRVGKVPDLLVTSCVAVPAAAGVFKPRILVPPGLLESLSRDERRAIFLHELAHVRRHDVAVNWLLALVQIVHWFNPVLWFAFARLRADRELARDAMVLSLSKQSDPRDYVRTLLKLSESVSTAGFPDLLAPTPHAAVGMYGGKNGLKRRLHMIARLPKSHRRFDWTGPALALALVGALLTSAKSQTPDAHSPPATQPTPSVERHEIKVPVLSEMPIVGRLFTSESGASAKEPAPEVYTPDEIARVDPQMQNRLNQLNEVKVKIETQSAAVGPKNAALIAVKSELAVRQKNVDDYAAQFNREYVIERRSDGTLVVKFSPRTKVDESTGYQATADQKKTTELIGQTRKLVDDGKYSEALDRVNDILKIDPKNDYGVGVKPLLEDKVQYARQKQILRYPTDFADPKQPQGPDEKPDETQKKILDQLDRTLPALTFDAVGFNDVIDFLRDVSRTNIFVNWKSLAAAKIDRNSPVSANLRNVKFSKALSVILDSVGGDGRTKLGYTVDQGVITISTQDDLARNVVVRVYDIRDLVVIVPDFVPTPEGAKAAPATRPVTREDLVQSLTKLIMDTVNTDSWKDRGGSVGALRELQGQLIITQTPENHKQIANLLEVLREQHSIQITVETRFVSCDQKIMDNLIGEWTRSESPPAPVKDPPSAPGGTSDTGKKTAGIFLNEAQVSQFMKLIQSASESVITTSPRVTLWNGQHAYVKVAASRAYLSGYTPTTKGDGEVRYEPVMKSVDPGLVVDVLGTVSSDRRFVTVSLHPQVTTLLGFERVPWAGSPKNVDLMVQEPRLKTSEIQTTLTIPDGGCALLSGLADPNFGPETSGTPATRPSAPRGIYLMVRPTIIRSNPAESREFPQLTPTNRK